MTHQNQDHVSKKAPTRVRQAVVVIHGMGDQRPNNILRSFVTSSIGELDKKIDGEPIIFSRPDKVSDKYDARRYQALATDDNTQTEFYEYHWAHHMEGNKLIHLWPLIRRLMLRWPWNVPPRLRLFWLLLVGLLVMSTWIVAFAVSRGVSGNPQDLMIALGFGGLTIYGVQLVIKVLNYFLTRYMADVARYLDAAPGNQKVRDVIRKELVELLDGLHQAGRYDRIIVVAHSLGTFIAYDAITHLWARKNKLHMKGRPQTDFKDLCALEIAATKLAEQESALRLSGRSAEQIRERTCDLRLKYRKLQKHAWVEKRLSGNPWLITDLLTFGSPLTHAHILLEPSRKALRRSQALFELPCCPPEREPFKDNRWHEYNSYSWKDEDQHRIIHHAGPFALVRWTNVWYSTDWFAGPLAPNFGSGIEDVALTADSWKTRMPLLSHTQYFSHPRNAEAPGFKKQVQSALDLKADDWLAPTLRSPEPDMATLDNTGSR